MHGAKVKRVKSLLFLLTLSLNIIFRNQKILLENVCCVDSTVRYF